MKKLNSNYIFINIILFLVLIFLCIISLSYGELSISFIDSIRGLLGKADSYTNSIILEIRMPRVVAGAFIGFCLSVSGLFTATSMRNPLADSSILGIQSGATIGGLLAILVFPSMLTFLPVFAFIGGLLAFTLLTFMASSKAGFKSNKIILVGVAINSLGTSIIGIITMSNSQELQNALTWLNGSLANVILPEAKIIAVYASLFIFISMLCIPILKILLLDDTNIISIGYNPNVLRFVIALIAVMLASIGVAYVGLIAFLGIIAPQIARRIVGSNYNFLVITSGLIGSIILVGTDLFQRFIFSPSEIPVGVLIGIFGATLFIFLAKGSE